MTDKSLVLRALQAHAVYLATPISTTNQSVLKRKTFPRSKWKYRQEHRNNPVYDLAHSPNIPLRTVELVSDTEISRKCVKLKNNPDATWNISENNAPTKRWNNKNSTHQGKYLFLLRQLETFCSQKQEEQISPNCGRWRTSQRIKENYWINQVAMSLCIGRILTL